MSDITTKDTTASGVDMPPEGKCPTCAKDGVNSYVFFRQEFNIIPPMNFFDADGNVHYHVAYHSTQYECDAGHLLELYLLIDGVDRGADLTRQCATCNDQRKKDNTNTPEYEWLPPVKTYIFKDITTTKR